MKPLKLLKFMWLVVRSHHLQWRVAFGLAENRRLKRRIHELEQNR
jgi:hypothetical protein